MYDRILMAVDHSYIAERVINAARELASLSNGEVWVLHLREMETMGGRTHHASCHRPSPPARHTAPYGFGGP